MIILVVLIFLLVILQHIDIGKLIILYEDKYILVIYKPVNISVHDSADWNSATIVDTLLDHGYELYDTDIPYQDGVIHRLDVGTSGILVFAKNEMAYKNLKMQFKQRTVKKIYHALIQGKIEPSFGTIDKPIGLINDENNIYGVAFDGKSSTTHYRTLKVFTDLKIIKDASLMEINLKTGRTHQIRVHFSHINHPLVGDVKYGSNIDFDKLIGLDHQWLHAKRLEFDHPKTGKRMYFDSDYPEPLKRSLELLNNKNEKVMKS